MQPARRAGCVYVGFRFIVRIDTQSRGYAVFLLPRRPEPVAVFLLIQKREGEPQSSFNHAEYVGITLKDRHHQSYWNI